MIDAERLASIAQSFEHAKKQNKDFRNTDFLAEIAFAEIPWLLELVEVLMAKAHDLALDSSAYQRGLKEGAAAEREAIAQEIDGASIEHPEVSYLVDMVRDRSEQTG